MCHCGVSLGALGMVCMMVTLQPSGWPVGVQCSSSQLRYGALRRAAVDAYMHAALSTCTHMQHGCNSMRASRCADFVAAAHRQNCYYTGVPAISTTVVEFHNCILQWPPEDAKGRSRVTYNGEQGWEEATGRTAPMWK
jgi:hypothetical protein